MIEQQKGVELSSMIEAMANQQSLKVQMEEFGRALQDHMVKETENQKKFISILNDMRLEVQSIHHDVKEERQLTEIQMGQCKASLRSDIIKEMKSDVDSLKLELLGRFDRLEAYQKDVNSKNHADFKDIYRRLEQVESTQLVYGEYIGGMKKIIGTITVVIVAGVMVAIGLKK